MAVHTFNLNLERQKRMDLREFETSVVYIVSSYVGPHYGTLSKRKTV